MSGQSMISIYAPDSQYKVISREEWWSDKHDGTEYWQDFDFERPFFEQFQELLLKVPRIGLFNINPNNSDYCQQAYDNMNCYMCNVIEKCEDCMYITHSNHIKDTFDSSFLHHSELCYECLDSDKLYSCIGCQSCQNSNNLLHCYDCIGCHDCVGCYGLRNKSYYIMNKAYSKEEYEKQFAILELNKYSKYLNCKKYFVELSKSSPHRSTRNLNVENSSGNYLINSRNSHGCFDSFETQDCAYSTWIFNSHDCYDVYGMGHGEFVLAGLGVEKLNKCAFNTFVSDSNDCFYSDCSFYSSDLFGCTGLKNKKFCILNKQYNESEYVEMKARIIEHMKKTGEWGQFFPVSLSPFAYNETAASYRYPLEKAEAEKLGFRWREADKRDYMPQTYELPDDLKTTESVVCEQTLACKDCGKNYKIMPKELAFYKKMNIPVPRQCLDCRFKDRFGLRNPSVMYVRKCEKCAAEISTSYEPGRVEKVYCEACYAEMVN